MRSRLSWLMLVPAVVLLLAAIGLGCGGSGKNPFSVATPDPPGPFIRSICVVGPTAATPVSTPTPAPTPVVPCQGSAPNPLPAQNMGVPQQYQFVAIATMSDNSGQDVTNFNSTNWSSSHPNVLRPDTNKQGNFIAVCSTGVMNCPLSITATSGGVQSNAFAVMVTGCFSCQ